jgi:hypothetical protein
LNREIIDAHHQHLETRVDFGFAAFMALNFAFASLMKRETDPLNFLYY